MVKYKGKECVMQFIVLSSWETLLGKKYERWAIDISWVRVKFVTLYVYKYDLFF